MSILYIDNLYAKSIDGNNFTDSIFRTSGNKDLLQVKFTIRDNKSNQISFIKIYIFKNDDYLKNTIRYENLKSIINKILERYDTVDVHLMVAYIDDEASFLELKSGQEVLVLTNTFMRGDSVYCYVEECLKMEEYYFFDAGR